MKGEFITTVIRGEEYFICKEILGVDWIGGLKLGSI